jgi:cardiolipin synthase
MFARAGAEPPRFRRLSRTEIKRDVITDEAKLLLSGPGRGRSPFKRSLSKDLAGARDVQIMVAYFLPTWRIRRELIRVARRGGRVRLIFPGKTDVPLSQYACRSLYRRLLRAGIEIYEYQPQILHAKLIIIDDLVYAGSSNLDPRSLYINYELMVRFQNKKLVAGAREIFAKKLEHCQRIELEAWKKSSTWWRRMRQRWAYFLLVRVDPLVARWDYRRTRR